MPVCGGRSAAACSAASCGASAAGCSASPAAALAAGGSASAGTPAAAASSSPPVHKAPRPSYEGTPLRACRTAGCAGTFQLQWCCVDVHAAAAACHIGGNPVQDSVCNSKTQCATAAGDAAGDCWSLQQFACDLSPKAPYRRQQCGAHAAAPLPGRSREWFLPAAPPLPASPAPTSTAGHVCRTICATAFIESPPCLRLLALCACIDADAQAGHLTCGGAWLHATQLTCQHQSCQHDDAWITE